MSFLSIMTGLMKHHFWAFGCFISQWDLSSLLSFMTLQNMGLVREMFLILLELVLKQFVPNFIQISQIRWELAICIDTATWRGGKEELLQIHMECMSSVSEHGWNPKKIWILSGLFFFFSSVSLVWSCLIIQN